MIVALLNTTYMEAMNGMTHKERGIAYPHRLGPRPVTSSV
jgi:hypothetical protein